MLATYLIVVNSNFNWQECFCELVLNNSLYIEAYKMKSNFLKDIAIISTILVLIDVNMAKLLTWQGNMYVDRHMAFQFYIVATLQCILALKQWHVILIA